MNLQVKDFISVPEKATGFDCKDCYFNNNGCNIVLDQKGSPDVEIIRELDFKYGYCYGDHFYKLKGE